MKAYLDLVQHVLEVGTRKENRTGVDTISTFNYNYEHDLRDGFPLLTTKKISWKNIVIENLWFLSGDRSIKLLQKHGCKFWDPWVEPNDRMEVPSAYGNFWRHFPVHNNTSGGQVVATADQFTSVAYGPEADPNPGSYNDQIAWVLAELRRNPMSRRMIVSAWAPGNAQTSKLPPCHYTFALNVQNMYRRFDPMTPGTNSMDYIEKRLCLHMTQRSCDTALGVPYNLAGYAFLLHLFAHLSGIKPGIFGHTLIDAHVYTRKPDGSQAEFDHVPGLLEQLRREPHPLPRLTISDSIRELSDISALLDKSTEEVMSHFVLDGYDPWPKIDFKVAV
jgi:thymidylate synthase